MIGKKASILSDTDNYFLFSLNAHLASGMSSALFRVKDGPIGMTQGFAIGYAFMYMIDNVSFTFASCISMPLRVYIDVTVGAWKIAFPGKAVTRIRRVPNR